MGNGHLPQLKGGMMNVNQLIWELRNERSRLDEAILALERLIPNRRGNRRSALRLVRGTPRAVGAESPDSPNQEVRRLR